MNIPFVFPFIAYPLLSLAHPCDFPLGKDEQKIVLKYVEECLNDRLLKSPDRPIIIESKHCFNLNGNIYFPVRFSAKSGYYGNDKKSTGKKLEFSKVRNENNTWHVSVSYNPNTLEHPCWGVEAVGCRQIPNLGTRLLVVYKAGFARDYELAPAVFSFDQKGDCVYDEASTQVVAAAKCKQWTISAMNKILKDKKNKK